MILCMYPCAFTWEIPQREVPRSGLLQEGARSAVKADLAEEAARCRIQADAMQR